MDCLQYFTKSVGTIHSFNWKDTSASNTRQLADMDYHICFRSEVISNKVCHFDQLYEKKTFFIYLNFIDTFFFRGQTHFVLQHAKLLTVGIRLVSAQRILKKPGGPQLRFRI